MRISVICLLGLATLVEYSYALPLESRSPNPPLHGLTNGNTGILSPPKDGQQLAPGRYDNEDADSTHELRSV